MDAIVVDALEKTYGKDVHALAGMTFSVPAGQVFGLLGPNGAGKSTTVRILVTLSAPDGGSASVAGHDVRREPGAVRRALGYVPQSSGIDREGTGLENLVLQGRLQGMRGAGLERRARELLELFTLSEKADALVRTYSGGQKRRLDVAMGLIHRPRVLFLDEPTTGLDPEARAAMWDELSRLASAESLTILLTTHYLEEADRLAERVAIVSQGKVVVDGTPEALKHDLRGDAVAVELDERRRRPGPDARPRVARRPRSGRRRSPRTRTCRARCPCRARDARRPRRRRCRRQVRDGLAAVTRRRLPPLHRTRLPLGRPGRNMSAVSQTLFLFFRLMRNLLRQPIWIAMMLIQPMFWLLLYSQLFRRITDLPGFGTTSYVDYLTPGHRDHDRFLLRHLGRDGDDRGPRSRRDRALPRDAGETKRDRLRPCPPVGRGGDDPGDDHPRRGLFLGATNGGPLGWLVIMFSAFLVASGFSGISNGIALLTRQEATMIAIANFIGLPLLFFSSILIAASLIPDWMETLSLANPVEWAVRASRAQALPGTDWGDIGLYLLLLACFTALTGAFATRCFRSYQRTL